MDDVPFPQDGACAQVRPGVHDGAGTDPHAGLDHHEGAYVDVVRQLGAWINDGGFVDHVPLK